ncbi:MAG: galactokinase [Tepidisphaerales bacterium]
MDPSTLQTLRQRFDEVFGPGDGPVRVVRAPGRVNLIGEHTDYNDGFVFPMAIEPEIRAAFRVRDDTTARFASTRRAGSMVSFDVTAALTPHPEPKHWSNYLMGPVHFLQRHPALVQTGARLRGVDVLLDNTLPEGSGLSSSAALEVAVVHVMLAALGPGHRLPVSEIAQICQKAEHAFPRAPVGIMDMTASAGGKAGHAMLLDCRTLHIRYVPLPPQAVRVVILNTRVQHSLAGGAGEYAVRRRQCEEAARVLGKPALRDVTLEDVLAARGRLDEVVFRRARHVVTENARCLAAADALDRGDYAEMGRLMQASHASLRDDYEVSCEELDFMAEQAMTVQGVYGARMTGGGFGGSAVALCRPDAVESLCRHIAEAYPGRFGLTPDLLATVATDGAGEVT